MTVLSTQSLNTVNSIFIHKKGVKKFDWQGKSLDSCLAAAQIGRKLVDGDEDKDWTSCVGEYKTIRA